LLVHAPTTDELKNEARTAHVAIPFMEAFRKDFFHPSTTPDLRLVAQFGVGLEGVDMDEASAQGIAVTNVPAEGTGNAQATAEHAVFLGISLLRGIPTQNFTSRFPSRSLGGLPIPRTLYRKRVTVVGYGAVGSCLARYLSVLGAEVTVVRRMPWDNTADEGFGDGIPPIHKADDLQEALTSADILFLACTLTPETKSLVNATTIEWLPKGALVVNIARGGLVDHGAMLDALRSGAVGGFASDVGIGHPQKVAEPWDPDDEICHLGPNANVLFTPHIGGYCDASYDVMAQKISDAIEHVIRGEAPPVWVNEPKR
jgi:lactate dehydrogenase-like 2-hydroxyacid dehydrogenase